MGKRVGGKTEKVGIRPSIDCGLDKVSLLGKGGKMFLATTRIKKRGKKLIRRYSKGKKFQAPRKKKARAEVLLSGRLRQRNRTKRRSGERILGQKHRGYRRECPNELTSTKREGCLHHSLRFLGFGEGRTDVRPEPAQKSG